MIEFDQTTILGLLAALRQAVLHETSPFLSAKTAAKHLGICDKLFRSLVRSGKIRFKWVGRRRKFTTEGLE